MTPERWRQLEELHDAVRDLSSTERGARLKGVDPELALAVEAILAQKGSQRDHAAWDGLGLPYTTAPLKDGDQFGPYQVLGPIGAGGMGDVYKARDTRLGRTVWTSAWPSGFQSLAGALPTTQRPRPLPLPDR